MRVVGYGCWWCCVCIIVLFNDTYLEFVRFVENVLLSFFVLI